MDNLTLCRFPLQPYRTETYRISLFPSTRVELMVSAQKKILRYVTIRLKWKPALSISKFADSYWLPLLNLHD